MSVPPEHTVMFQPSTQYWITAKRITSVNYNTHWESLPFFFYTWIKWVNYTEQLIFWVESAHEIILNTLTGSDNPIMDQLYSEGKLYFWPKRLNVRGQMLRHVGNRESFFRVHAPQGHLKIYRQHNDSKCNNSQAVNYNLRLSISVPSPGASL